MVKQIIFSKGIGGAENATRVLRHHRFDCEGTINHTHLPRADLFGFYRKLVHREQWVVTIHGHYGRWRGRVFMPLMFKVWGKADRIVAISQELKRWLVETGGISEEKISVIHYGVKVSNVSQRKPTKCGSLIVGSIGRLEPRKGHDILIRAMKRVVWEIPEAELKIVGRDERGYGEWLMKLARGLGVSRNVTLMGELPRGEIEGFLDGITIYAQASRVEGLGLTVLEAMARGKRVVVSDIPAFREIVPKEIGLVPLDEDRFAEALIVGLKDGVRERQNELVMDHIRQHYSISSMLNRHEEIYAHLYNLR